MPQDSKTIIDRINKQLDALKKQNKDLSREVLDQRFKQCIHYAVKEAYKHAEKKQMQPSDVATQLTDNDLNSQGFYREYKDAIGALIARDQQLTNELHQLRTVENAQGRRNALWRFVSTLAVGGAILLIYAVADWLDIALPLSGIK